MRELDSEIDIAASADRVWEILADFASYPDWNPFIRKISGETRAGSKLEVRIQPPGSRGFTFRPHLLEFKTGSRIRWLGSFAVPGLLDGEHSLAIEELDSGRTLFRQREKFTGLLVPLFRRTLAATLRGFEEMNLALKKRAESPS